MPILLFHTNTDSLMFVVEIFCSFVVPYPTLLLHIAMTVSSALKGGRVVWQWHAVGLVT